VTDEFLRRHPDWVARYGELARKRGIEDAGFHVDVLAGALETGSPAAFCDYARWCSRLLRSRKIAPQFLAENLRLNGLPPMKYVHGDWESAGDDAAATAGRLPPGGFDLIVGSDVLYERDAGGALAGFVSRHAKASCEVWIVDPDRSNRPAFNRHMAAAGFARHEERLDVAATPTAAAYKGRLLVYRRKLAPH
jgi:hypothetical protein